MQPQISLGIISAVVILIAVLTTLFFQNLSSEKPQEAEQGPPVTSIPVEPPEQKPALPPPLGDRVLQSYGSATSSLEADLTLFKNYLSNVFILVKQRDPRHYATNEDLAEFLRGQQGQSEVYLSADSPTLNEDGQLVDRFGSPLIVHPHSRDQLEIRSSGPDRVPYTQDDIVR